MNIGQQAEDTQHKLVLEVWRFVKLEKQWLNIKGSTADLLTHLNLHTGLAASPCFPSCSVPSSSLGIKEVLNAPLCTP